MVNFVGGRISLGWMRGEYGALQIEMECRHRELSKWDCGYESSQDGHALYVGPYFFRAWRKPAVTCAGTPGGIA